MLPILIFLAILLIAYFLPIILSIIFTTIAIKNIDNPKYINLTFFSLIVMGIVETILLIASNKIAEAIQFFIMLTYLPHFVTLILEGINLLFLVRLLKKINSDGNRVILLIGIEIFLLILTIIFLWINRYKNLI